MSKWFTLIIVALTLFSGVLASATDVPEPDQPDCGPVKVPNRDGWCVPRLEPAGDLAKIFEFGDCRRISGLSCELRYNGKLPFPDKVLFAEYDEKGKLLAKGGRLRFYTDPDKAGPERITGAMFWFKSNDPSRIVLWGVWNDKKEK
jgi:hypothetical protein